MSSSRSGTPKAPYDPRPGDRLSARAVDAGEFAADLLVEDALIADVALSGESAEFAEIGASRLEGGTLADTDWHRCSLVDVVVDGVDLANARFVESLWRRMRLERCRLTGVVLAGCILEDVTIAGGVLDLTNWRFAQLTRVRFESCTLTGADFLEAQLNDVSFEGCDLSGSQFSQARCRRTRLSGCRLDAVQGVTGLAGATIAPTDLLSLTEQLAEALGIGVDWEE